MFFPRNQVRPRNLATGLEKTGDQGGTKRYSQNEDLVVDEEEEHGPLGRTLVAHTIFTQRLHEWSQQNNKSIKFLSILLSFKVLFIQKITQINDKVVNKENGNHCNDAAAMMMLVDGLDWGSNEWSSEWMVLLSKNDVYYNRCISLWFYLRKKWRWTSKGKTQSIIFRFKGRGAESYTFWAEKRSF